MGAITTLSGRGRLATPPTEIADEVELYARENDRHGTLDLVPILFAGKRIVRAAWVVRFTLRADDKRMSLYQTGVVDKPPTEDVWLVEPNPKAGEPIPGIPDGREPQVLALDIGQMGASGVRTFLDRGNMWSGRGKYASLEDQFRQNEEYNEDLRHKIRAEHKQANRYEQREKRRQRFKIPFIPVEFDLEQKATN